MARLLRIEFGRAGDHVLSIGPGCRAVFTTDEHRRYFLTVEVDMKIKEIASGSRGSTMPMRAAAFFSLKPAWSKTGD